MAVNIFEKYGIKQVANVYFEALEDDFAAKVFKGDIVLFLDTLKVSTIETTAENVAAQGGWGNPRLISWDYGKEINVTLTDALMSLESLRFMMGGAIKEANSTTGGEIWVKHTAEVVANANGVIPVPTDRFTGKPYSAPTAVTGHPIKVINLTKGTRSQIETGSINGTTPLKMRNTLLPGSGNYNAETVVSAGDRLRIFWEEQRTGGEHDSGAVEVTISPNTFPGTYRVVGDTFMRNSNGKDEPFQFIIDKAKVQSNVTLTLEAEGDPTTFEMTLQVLRGESGDEMMKLVRYGTETSGTSGSDQTDKGSLQSGGA